MPAAVPENQTDTPLFSSNRSEELNEVINLPPVWIVRWGTSLFLLLLLILLLCSWFIHYPDLVQAPLRLTTVDAPKGVNAKIDGKLVRLLVKEEDRVQQGEVMAYLESTADHQEAMALGNELEELRAGLIHRTVEASASLKEASFSRLGELQSAYQTFAQAYTQFLTFQRRGFFSHKRQMIQQEIANVTAITTNLRTQRALYSQDLALVQREVSVQRKLLDQRVIAPADLRREESRLVPKELALEQAQFSILQNEALLLAKQKELLELDKLMAEQRGNFLQALNTLRSAVENWKSRYLLVAPASGRVFFATILEEKQTLTINQEVFYIDPETGAYYGEMAIPQQDIGKIQVGQTVLVKLAGYPYQEFGVLTGRVTYISQIPSREDGFLAKVAFPQGLETSYGKKVVYRNGMSAAASIMTTDSRLFEKLFYSFRRVVSR